jgi:hypothetical protein
VLGAHDHGKLSLLNVLELLACTRTAITVYTMNLLRGSSPGLYNTNRASSTRGAVGFVAYDSLQRWSHRQHVSLSISGVLLDRFVAVPSLSLRYTCSNISSETFGRTTSRSGKIVARAIDSATVQCPGLSSVLLLNRNGGFRAPPQPPGLLHNGEFFFGLFLWHCLDRKAVPVLADNLQTKPQHSPS